MAAEYFRFPPLPSTSMIDSFIPVLAPTLEAAEAFFFVVLTNEPGIAVLIIVNDEWSHRAGRGLGLKILKKLKNIRIS